MLEQSKLIHNSERGRINEEEVLGKLKASDYFADYVKVEEVKEAFEKLTDSFNRRFGGFGQNARNVRKFLRSLEQRMSSAGRSAR